MIRRWVVVVSCVIAALALLVLTRCSEPPQELDGEPVEVESEPLTEAEEEESQEPDEEPVTSRDVREEILDGFRDTWSERMTKRAKAQSIDVSLQIFRLGQEKGVDPILLADEYVDLLHTTLDMQPAFEKGWDGGIQRAMLIAIDLYRGAHEAQEQSCHDIDERFSEDVASNNVPHVSPYHLLSMGYRESRLARRIELGKKLGGRGERGMFQFLPQSNGKRGWIEGRFMPRFKNNQTRERCSPFDRLCATRGAANALAWIRCRCIELYDDRCTTDVFMAGYGMNRMPTPEEARHHRGPVNARRFLCAVRDDCDELWPRDHDDDFALSL
jgi:hypothetical protein